MKSPRDDGAEGAIAEVEDILQVDPGRRDSVAGDEAAKHPAWMMTVAPGGVVVDSEGRTKGTFPPSRGVRSARVSPWGMHQEATIVDPRWRDPVQEPFEVITEDDGDQRLRCARPIAIGGRPGPVVVRGQKRHLSSVVFPET